MPTEEQIRIHNEEAELDFIAGTAWLICLGYMTCDEFLRQAPHRKSKPQTGADAVVIMPKWSVSGGR